MPTVETTRRILIGDKNREEVMAEEERRAAGDLCRAALQRGGRPFGAVSSRRLEEGEEETWVFELEYSE